MAEAQPHGPKRRRLESAGDILGPVRDLETREDTLVTRLTEYVERIDTDMVRAHNRPCETLENRRPATLTGLNHIGR